MEHLKQARDMEHWIQIDNMDKEAEGIRSVRDLIETTQAAWISYGFKKDELYEFPQALNSSNIQYLGTLGIPYVNAELLEAAVCKVNHMTLFGIGSKEMQMLSSVLGLPNAKLKSLRIWFCQLEKFLVLNHIEHLDLDRVDVDWNSLGAALQSPHCKVWDLRINFEEKAVNLDWLANMLQNQEGKLRRLALHTLGTNPSKLLKAFKSVNCKLEGLEWMWIESEHLDSIGEVIPSMKNLWFFKHIVNDYSEIEKMIYAWVQILSSTTCKLRSLFFFLHNTDRLQLPNLQDRILNAIEGNPHSLIQKLYLMRSWQSCELEKRYQDVVARNATNLLLISQGQSYTSTRANSGRKQGLGKEKDPFTTGVKQMHEKTKTCHIGKEYDNAMIEALRKICKDPINDFSNTEKREAFIKEMEDKHSNQVCRGCMKKRFEQLNKNRRDKLFRQLRDKKSPSREEYPDYVIKNFGRILEKEQLEGKTYEGQRKAGKLVRNRHRTGRTGKYRKALETDDACVNENEEGRALKRAKNAPYVDISTLKLDLSIWSREITDFRSIEDSLPLEFRFKGMHETVDKQSWTDLERGSMLNTAIVHLYTMFLLSFIPPEEQAHWLFYDPITLVNLKVKVPKNFSIQGVKYLVFPLCYRKHWCLYFARLETKQMWCFDSLNNDLDQEAANFMTKTVDELLVKSGQESLKLVPEMITSPRQTDGYSCGLHVMVCMKLLVLAKGESSTEQFGTEGWYSPAAPEQERKKLVTLVKAAVHGVVLASKVENFQASSGNTQIEESFTNANEVDVNTETENISALTTSLNGMEKAVQQQEQEMVDAHVSSSPVEGGVHSTTKEHFIAKLNRLFPDVETRGSMIVAAFNLSPMDRDALFSCDDATLLTALKKWQDAQFIYKT